MLGHIYRFFGIPLINDLKTKVVESKQAMQIQQSSLMDSHKIYMITNPILKKNFGRGRNLI